MHSESASALPAEASRRSSQSYLAILDRLRDSIKCDTGVLSEIFTADEQPLPLKLAIAIDEFCIRSCWNDNDDLLTGWGVISPDEFRKDIFWLDRLRFERIRCQLEDFHEKGYTKPGLWWFIEDLAHTELPAAEGAEFWGRYVRKANHEVMADRFLQRQLGAVVGRVLGWLRGKHICADREEIRQEAIQRFGLAMLDTGPNRRKKTGPNRGQPVRILDRLGRRLYGELLEWARKRFNMTRQRVYKKKHPPWLHQMSGDQLLKLRQALTEREGDFFRLWISEVYRPDNEKARLLDVSYPRAKELKAGINCKAREILGPPSHKGGRMSK